MLKQLGEALDALIKGIGSAVADIRDKGVLGAFFNLNIPERLGDLGWFRDRSGDDGKGIGPPEHGSSPSPGDTHSKSLSITSGWDFAKDLTREREGQSIER